MDSQERDRRAKLAKQKYETRFKKVSIRYASEDYNSIREFAEIAGKEISTYVHDISLNPRFRIIPAPPQINIQAKAEIQKIGVNINQIARSLNNQFGPNESEKIKVLLNNTVQILRSILERL